MSFSFERENDNEFYIVNDNKKYLLVFQYSPQPVKDDPSSLGIVGAYILNEDGTTLCYCARSYAEYIRSRIAGSDFTKSVLEELADSVKTKAGIDLLPVFIEIAQTKQH